MDGSNIDGNHWPGGRRRRPVSKAHLRSLCLELKEQGFVCTSTWSPTLELTQMIRCGKNPRIHPEDKPVAVFVRDEPTHSTKELCLSENLCRLCTFEAEMWWVVLHPFQDRAGRPSWDGAFQVSRSGLPLPFQGSLLAEGAGFRGLRDKAAVAQRPSLR